MKSDGYLSGTVLFLCLLNLSHSEIPSFLKICRRTDPQVGQCIANSVRHLVPYLKVGIPQYGIPSIEPLQVNNVKLNTGNDAARVYANLTHIRVWNASTFELHNLTANARKNTFRFHVSIPNLRLEGNYQVDTKILFLQVRGDGPFNINVSNYHFDCTMKGDLATKKNIERLIFEKMHCEIAFSNATIRLEKLFHQNEVLEKATNEVINDNLELFYDALKPNLLDSITTTFTDISNKITENFDYNEVFPV